MPLIHQIFAELNQAEKGSYLGKLISNDEFTPENKQKFILDYFGKQPETMALLQDLPEQEQQTFKEIFLDELTRFLKDKVALIGLPATRASLTAKPGKIADAKDPANQNANKLIYRVGLSFEKQKIASLIQKKLTAHEIDETKANQYRKLLEAGKLKLVTVNGTQEIITQEEAVAAAKKYPNATVTPFIAMEDSGTPNLDGSTTNTFEGLVEEFNSAAAANLEQDLESKGLEVVADFKVKDGVATGQVRDADGKTLQLKADLNLPDQDPKKYQFEFAPETDLQQEEAGLEASPDPLTGQVFYLNQDGLNKFNPADGKRKSAKEVGKSQLSEGMQTETTTDQSEPTPSSSSMGGAATSFTPTSAPGPQKFQMPSSAGKPKVAPQPLYTSGHSEEEETSDEQPQYRPVLESQYRLAALKKIGKAANALANNSQSNGQTGQSGQPGKPGQKGQTGQSKMPGAPGRVRSGQQAKAQQPPSKQRNPMTYAAWGTLATTLGVIGGASAAANYALSHKKAAESGLSFIGHFLHLIG